MFSISSTVGPLLSEICFNDFRIFGHIGRLAQTDDRAMIEHQKSVGQTDHRLHRMLDDHDGDAAGRKEVNGLKRDFSADDIYFAKALGVRFFTPELYFLGADPRLEPAADKSQESKPAV